ncbi:glycosyltransferase family 2 protein [Nitrosophilus kaiyonis]|uniref:glycosyltransferase family 2 protein n=1 Tax=Nitrosophilus kaiyonis TaxID=2930200 RepID=UPI0024925F4C|nr:glycosyltransferase family 2 protein [Nitrosophilus kaiyonis]
MNKLSIAIITYNSEKYLNEVIKSASFADEILILDSGSTDKTVEIAKKLGANVEFQKWLGFGKQKQKAIDLAKNRWIFVLDSDEIITEKLQNEIKEVLKNPKYDAYEVPRLNYFFGKPIKYGGLYPDKTVRLFDRNKARFSEDEVHEKVIVDGKIGELKSYMKHYAYENIEEFINKQNRYSSLGAKKNRIKAIFNPFWTFLKMYILNLGFLDGWEGFVIAKLYSEYTFWKYIKGKD